MIIILSLLVFTIGLIPRFMAARAVDMTWDEATYLYCGTKGISNILHRRFASKDWEFEFHPPLGMVIIGSSYGLFMFLTSIAERRPISEETLRLEGINSFHGQRALLAIRAPSIVLGSLTAAAVSLLVFEISSNYELALSAGLFTAIAPNFVAWSSLAMLEAPLTLFYVASILMAILATATNSALFLIGSGLLFGLTIGTKISAAMALPVFLIWFLPEGFLFPALWAVSALIVYYAVWPALWRNPIASFFRNLRAQRALFASNKRERITFYFENFFATTPVPLLLGAILGFLSVHSLSRDPIFLISMGAFVPLIMMSLPKVPKYGVNVSIYVLPLVAILASIGLARVENSLGIPWNLVSITAILSVSLSLIVSYPYFAGYQNFVSKFVTKTNGYLGYWGEGLSGGIQYVEENASRNATIWVYAPKSTSLYHSTRVNMDATFGKESMFFLREKAGFQVAVEPEVYHLRTGDIRFFYPYYYDYDAVKIEEAVRNEGVEFVVLYRAALSEIWKSSVSDGNNKFCEFIHDECKPTHTVSLKGVEVCWVFKVDNSFLQKLGHLSQGDGSSAVSEEKPP